PRARAAAVLLRPRRALAGAGRGAGTAPPSGLSRGGSSAFEGDQLLVSGGNHPHVGAESRVLHLVLEHVGGDQRGQDGDPFSTEEEQLCRGEAVLPVQQRRARGVVDVFGGG